MMCREKLAAVKRVIRSVIVSLISVVLRGHTDSSLEDVFRLKSAQKNVDSPCK